MLQNKIEQIQGYFKSLENFNDALVVKVQFPPKWAIYPSEDKKIKVANSEQVPYEYFYYGHNKDVNLDDIFDFILETIQLNKNLEIKAKLLISKAKELQDLFENNPLEKLETLKFVMEDKKPKKRKYNKKAKADKVVEKAVQESATTENSVEATTISSTTESIVISAENKEVEKPKSALDKFKEFKKKVND